MNERISTLSVLLFLLVSILFLPDNSALADNYIIGPNDVLKINVYNHDDLQTTVQVTDSGDIVMPLLGRVKVGGMKIAGATDKITALLADGYIINPQVNIFIEKFRSKKAVILGHVYKPGLYELHGKITFLELLSKAGGLKEKAGDAATLKRKEEILLIDLESLIEKGDLSQNLSIQDGDAIFIPKGGMCYVTGEVADPDAYSCDANSTILKMITLAGGFTGKASKSGVRIVRIVDGEKKVFKRVELDTQVIPDDIIVVPESFF